MFNYCHGLLLPWESGNPAFLLCCGHTRNVYVHSGLRYKYQWDGMRRECVWRLLNSDYVMRMGFPLGDPCPHWPPMLGSSTSLSLILALFPPSPLSSLHFYISFQETEKIVWTHNSVCPPSWELNLVNKSAYALTLILQNYKKPKNVV